MKVMTTFKVEQEEDGMYTVIQCTLDDDKFLRKICECYHEESANIIANLLRDNNEV